MAVRHALIIALTLTVAAGCGEEAKPPAAAPAAPPAATPGSEPVAPEHPATPVAKDDAPAVEEKVAETGAAPAAVTPKPERPQRKLTPSGPMKPISLASFDPEVTVVVGTPSLELLVDAFTQAAGQAGEIPLPPDPLAAAREVLRMRLHLTDADWLDGTRPVKLAIPNPKAWQEGFIAVLPIRGGDAAVKAAFGATLLAAEGHSGKVTAEGRQVFLDFAGDTLVVTSHDALIGKLRAFVDGPLKAWQPAQPLVFEASVDNINRIFGKELQITREMAGALGAQITKRAAVQGQAKTVNSAIDGAFNFIADMTRFGVSIDPVGDSIRVSFGLRGVDGSGLADSIAETKGRPLGLAKLLPADTWFGALGNVPSEITDEDRALIKGYLTAPNPDGVTFSEAEAAKMIAIIDKLASLSAGDSAFAFATDGPFPAAMHSVSAATDGHAAREAVLELGQVVFDRLLAEAQARVAAEGGPGAELPVKDFAGALAFANQTAAPMGLAISALDETRDGGARVQALVVSIDWAKSGLAKQDPETFAVVKELVGPKLAVAVASADDRLALAAGPNAVEHAVALAKGTEVGGEPRLNAAAPGSFAALSLRMGKMLQALAAFPSLKARAAEFAKLPAAEAFVIEADSDGATMTATLHLPLNLLMGLFAIGG